MGKVAQKSFAHKNESLLMVRAGQEAFALNFVQAVCISIPSSSSRSRSPRRLLRCVPLPGSTVLCHVLQLLLQVCDSALEQAAEPTLPTCA